MSPRRSSRCRTRFTFSELRSWFKALPAQQLVRADAVALDELQDLAGLARSGDVRVFSCVVPVRLPDFVAKSDAGQPRVQFGQPAGRIVSAVFDGPDHIASLVSQQGVGTFLQRPVARQAVFAGPAAVR